MGLKLNPLFVFFIFQRKKSKLSECKCVINIPEVKNLIFQPSAPVFFLNPQNQEVYKCNQIGIRKRDCFSSTNSRFLSWKWCLTLKIRREPEQGKNMKVLLFLLSALIVDSTCCFWGKVPFPSMNMKTDS